MSDVVVPLLPLDDLLGLYMKVPTPSTIKKTNKYLSRGYRFLAYKTPMIITGMGLHDLAMTCVG